MQAAELGGGQICSVAAGTGERKVHPQTLEVQHDTLRAEGAGGLGQALRKASTGLGGVHQHPAARCGGGILLVQPQLQPGTVQRAGQGADEGRRGEGDNDAAVAAAMTFLQYGGGGAVTAEPGGGGEEQQAALHPAGQRQGAQRAVAVQPVGGADGRDARGNIILRAAGKIQLQIRAPPCFSAGSMVEYIYVL